SDTGRSIGFIGLDFGSRLCRLAHPVMALGTPRRANAAAGAVEFSRLVLGIIFRRVDRRGGLGCQLRYRNTCERLSASSSRAANLCANYELQAGRDLRRDVELCRGIRGCSV